MTEPLTDPLTDKTPAILTTKQHRECHDRWLRFKRDHPGRVSISKRVFGTAERSVLAFGNRLGDAYWIDPAKMHEDFYGPYDPVDTLLECLYFPPHSPIVDRRRYVERVSDMIVEHERYGSDGLYMPRSVVMGWILREHDLLLSDINEAA